MNNGQCPTWFIVKWLEKHPTHTAEAPKTTSKRSENMPSMFYPSYRSDWTIYNERGKRVRFKRRSELRRVGELGALERLTATAGSGEYPRMIASNNMSATFDVFIRERKQ